MAAIVTNLQFRLKLCRLFFGAEANSAEWAAPFKMKDDEPQTMSDLLATDPSMLPLSKESLPHFQPAAQINDEIQSIMKFTLAEELDQAKTAWAMAKTAIKCFEKSLSSAGKDTKSSVAMIDSGKKKKAKQEQKQKEKDEQDAAKLESDRRAKALLYQKRSGETKPVFKALAAMQDLRAVPKQEGHHTLHEAWYVPEPNESLRAWLSEEALQQTIESWATKHKTFSEFLSKGRTSAVMDEKCGGAHTSSVLSLFLDDDEVLNISTTLPQISEVTSACWLTAYSTDMQWCGLHPNGASTLKVSLMGHVRIYCMSLADLMRGLQSHAGLGEGHYPASLEACVELVESLTGEQLQKMRDDGLLIWVHDHEPGQLLCIPGAWMCLEVATAGPVLIGVRKGYFPSHSFDVEDYEMMMTLVQKSGKDTSRYQQVLDLVRAEPVSRGGAPEAQPEASQEHSEQAK